ncbi:MAG: dihydrodipicolinate synthase family protein [Planctomycetaceae bacterium]|nr:dihydrodipicolinate synthase family protein [Planctomycetaceae bacterium]
MSDNFDRGSLRTVHLVPLTAYDSSGRIDAELQAAHTARMATAGIRAYLPAAGTSEFHSLSADEIVELVRITREAAGSDAVIFAPVGLQVGHAIDVAKRSLDVGATGIMFMPFSHPYMSDEGAKDYYQAVMQAAPCPTLIYKKAPIPANSLLLELADHPNVVGIKYAFNNMHEFRRTVLDDSTGGSPKIEWLCGSAERFAPYYMLAGSTGYTTGAGNLCPYITLAMHAAFVAGEHTEGMRLQELLLPIEEYRARKGDSYNISMLKGAMKVLGQDFGPPRPPQRQLTDAEQAEIEALIRPLLAVDTEMQTEFQNAGLVG